MSSTMIIVMVLLIAAFVFVVVTYNGLIALIEAIKNSKRSIDIQLDRRFKVFENLISVVKESMDYEKTTLKDVVALRTQAKAAQASGNETARMAAENQISKVAAGINAVFESYPELQANKQALQLQEEIVNTENKLSFAKQAYNDSVERYEVKKKSFFEAIVVAIIPSINQKFEYWQVDEAKAQSLEDYKVNF